jgi:HSP20 family molecular chaperone IbpA
MRRQIRPFIKRFENWARDFSEDDFCSPDTDIMEGDENLTIRIDLPG